MVSSDLSITFLTDIHWHGTGEPPLPELDGTDLVLLGGDLTQFRGEEVARPLIEAIREAGPQVLAVCGNCDKPRTERYLVEQDIDLDLKAREIGSAMFIGLSGGLPFGACPYERTEEEYSAIADLPWKGLKNPLPGPVILVTHQPPSDTRCDLAGGRHVGSRAIRAAIEKHQPDLVLCGHIHESRGDGRVGKSRIINPGPWKDGFGLYFQVQEGALRNFEHLR